MAGAPGQDAARITQQPPPVLLIPHVRVYVRHEGDSESSPLPAGKLWKPVLRDMYDVVRAFQPNLTAIEITMDCNAGSMGLKEVQERLESARNEVARLAGMNLTDLIAEARAVRAYLFAPDSTRFIQRLNDRFGAVGRMNRICATLERLAASPYAPGIDTALRMECGAAQPIVAVMDAVDLEAR